MTGNSIPWSPALWNPISILKSRWTRVQAARALVVVEANQALPRSTRATAAAAGTGTGRMSRPWRRRRSGPADNCEEPPEHQSRSAASTPAGNSIFSARSSARSKRADRRRRSAQGRARLGVCDCRRRCCPRLPRHAGAAAPIGRPGQEHRRGSQQPGSRADAFEPRASPTNWMSVWRNGNWRRCKPIPRRWPRRSTSAVMRSLC